ncbi:hypothetical protein H181DRAFT_02755 [Streptomyces sp. WMMB 714]|uniref:hypothetical protein n=1 Tax=Streptomyces sp. WMMB 714 TaxID=1286822 RepID=UPI0005F881A8|nr:hypothetical protein [Streptomyces sp. WMMB 714]SCK33638.1 hypothetical protein H181DRAFT_02755 [Streptomyces sp. WMMB 714]
MRQVDRMLREMSGAHTVQVVDRWGSTKKLARLVLVAEQFGFMYGDTHQTGGRAPKTVLTLHRDPNPEAQRRAADSAARYPQALNGGDLPGMQPGPKLTPVPEAHPHLELLKARVTYDLTGKNAEKRVLMGAIGLTAGFAFLLVRNLASDRTAVGPVVGWGFFMLIIACGFLWTRRRHKRSADVLRQAGLVPVQDGQGRTRYLPPGAQLPGSHNPFAHQATGAPPQQGAPGPYGHPGAGQAPGPVAASPGQQQPPGPQQHPYAQQGPYPQQSPYGGPGQQPPWPQQPGPYQPQPGPQQAQPGPYQGQPGQAPSPYGPPQPPAGSPYQHGKGS